MEFPAWDPVLFDLPGPIDIRWYGLMYVVGFVIAQWIFVRLARAKLMPVSPEKAPDLILYCVFGVLLGGRIGYALFYENELLNPVRFVQVWGGGLSFHGGLLGVTVAFILFARKHGALKLRLADVCALAVPPGIFAVRMANFINGELYGRITEKGVGLAMQFPTDKVALAHMHISDNWPMRDRELCIQVAYGHRTWDSVKDALSPTDSFGQKIDWNAVHPHLDWAAAQVGVPFRHPSQLYEGFGEGLLVGLVLLAVYLLTRKRHLNPGGYGAIFLLSYAAVRFGIEFVRQPDAQFATPQDPIGRVFLGMTMGQLLCTGMVFGGLWMLWYAWRHPDRTAPAPQQEPAHAQ